MKNKVYIYIDYIDDYNKPQTLTVNKHRQAVRAGENIREMKYFTSGQAESILKTIVSTLDSVGIEVDGYGYTD